MGYKRNQNSTANAGCVWMVTKTKHTNLFGHSQSFGSFLDGCQIFWNAQVLQSTLVQFFFFAKIGQNMGNQIFGDAGLKPSTPIALLQRSVHNIAFAWDSLQMISSVCIHMFQYHFTHCLHTINFRRQPVLIINKFCQVYHHKHGCKRVTSSTDYSSKGQRSY